MRRARSECDDQARLLLASRYRNARRAPARDPVDERAAQLRPRDETGGQCRAEPAVSACAQRSRALVAHVQNHVVAVSRTRPADVEWTFHRTGRAAAPAVQAAESRETRTERRKVR